MSRSARRAPPATTPTSGSSRWSACRCRLLGFNLLATIITMRAPGMTWTRLPIFVWSVVATAILMFLASPMLIGVTVHGGVRPHRADRVLHPGQRRLELPVAEPVLGVRTPRGVHRRASGFRDRARAAPGVLPQALVGLPDRRRRHARGHAAELLRLAAPPVRQRHQRRPAAVLHALDRADLDSDRVHLPVRDGHALARANTADRADAVRASDGRSTSCSAASPACSCPTRRAT